MNHEFETLLKKNTSSIYYISKMHFTVKLLIMQNGLFHIDRMCIVV